MKLLKISLSICILLSLSACNSVANDVVTEVAKGDYVYKLKKEDSLKKEKFIVVEMNNYKIDELIHELAPDDDYLINFTVIPMSDESAVRGFKFFSAGGAGSKKIINDQELKDAQTLMKDVNRLAKVKFTVAIMPVDNLISEITIGKIEIGSEISISGIRYSHSEIIKNGEKQPLTHCLESMDVIRATDLKVY